MSWQALVEKKSERTLPWLGGQSVWDDQGRSWSLDGLRPPEVGWYVFDCGSNRRATWAQDDLWASLGADAWPVTARGYLVGDRVVLDGARVDPDPERLLAQTRRVWLAPLGLVRFSRASVGWAANGHDFLYLGPVFPAGPEPEVIERYQDRRSTLDGIKGVTPALDLAFRFLTREREGAEWRETERRRRLEEAERHALALQLMGTSSGRREVARVDFAAAARSALALSGAELLDWRAGRGAEVVVQYRLMARRFECVVDRETLQVLDAGICLRNHDRELSLESLPPTVLAADREGLLHVFRHADPDREDEDD